VLEDDEPAGYLGVAGGYITGSTSLEAEEDLSGIYWEETFQESKVDSLFKAFLESR
jgi:hypothetical protein